MTFFDYLKSREWDGIDVLNGTEARNVRLGIGSQRARFALYAAWCSQRAPELVDALGSVLGPRMRPSWKRRFWDRMATVPPDLARLREKAMSRVRCRDCSEEWKPDGPPWKVRVCRSCGGKWISIV